MRLPASWRTRVFRCRQAHRYRGAGLSGCRREAVLEGESRRYSRMLSSFVQLRQGQGVLHLPKRTGPLRQGVEVHQVNPAYSSVIGRVKFMERYGLSVHQAAALVLARRLLGCSERIPRQRACRPVGKRRQHVAFTVPARKREARVDVLGCDLVDN